MKMNISKDPLVCGLFGFVILLLLVMAGSFYALAQWWFLLLDGSVVVVLLWIMFDSKVIFKEEGLLVHVGPFYKRIAYEVITSVSAIDSIPISFALAHQQVVIAYRNTQINVSIKQRDQFIHELKKRSHLA